MADAATLEALAPVILLLFLAVTVAIASRAARLSPIVGYIALGLALRAGGLGLLFDKSTISVLAELGVMFLLFDIGLHFSLDHIRKQASDIFAFGPLQVLFASVALGLAALAFGMTLLPALLVGAVLALSSTAVVGRIIAERHQRNCPVGLTATSILIFQDVIAIFLLIVAGSLDGGGPLWHVALEALVKAVLAFSATAVIARLLIGPLLGLVARSQNEEIFTAVALLLALAAGWATGKIGLSLTLGAFLGGLTLADTPYRAVIESEIRPFRGLLLGFFFISIGLSLDAMAIARSLPAVIGLTGILLTIKIVSNIGASRLFRWSAPGSTQLGFLLAQGSEFAFVILSLPAARAAVGASRASIIIAVVALSIAVTPTLADAGRMFAGRMRKRVKKITDRELIPQLDAAPVIIVGMGMIGRTIADALLRFGITYCALERDQHRLQMAVADGYNAVFGDGSDIRLWKSVGLHSRKLVVLTAPDFDTLSETNSMSEAHYPDLKRYAVVKEENQAKCFRGIGLLAIVDNNFPPGIDAAVYILSEMSTPVAEITSWTLEYARQGNLPSAPPRLAA
ncbi:cation:proton antiporter [Undibacterium sp. TJN25]|uniref:cation:proton antiporter domain-containing protein n=1 Tax=Undibacterium sp. TJN25 TaxID=3413056 RepID=UPI003BF0D553